MSIARYRKRPVEVDAALWDGSAEGAVPIIDWILAGDGTATYVAPYLHSQSCRCDGRTRRVPSPTLGEDVMPCPETEPTGGTYLNIRTLEGNMRALPGDWIICGTRGEFYPCKPGPFSDTFDVVESLKPV